MGGRRQHRALLRPGRVVNVAGGAQELAFQVRKHDHASNPFFHCPLFVLCDAPVFTKVCLGSNRTPCRNPEPPFPMNATCSTSSEAWINPVPWRYCYAAGSTCTIAVQSQTWSRLKALYRD